MRIVVVLAFLVFSTVVFADQPAPIRPDPKLTPGATFDVTLQDVSARLFEKGQARDRGTKTRGVRRVWNH
jgi:hypothetical protein